MIRGISLTLASTLALLVAGVYTAAQDSGTTKGPTPGTITVTEGDSGQYRIVWVNRLKSDPDNWIIRRTIGGTDSVTIQVAGSKKSYVDRPAVPTGKTLSYSVWSLINGQADFYQAQSPKVAAPTATAVFCDDVKNLDSTLWMPIGGNWIIQDGAIVQKDDGPLSPGTPDIRASIFKNSNSASSVQLTASVQVNLAGELQKAFKAKSDAADAATKLAAAVAAAKTADDNATTAAATAAANKTSLDNALADAKSAATTAQAAAKTAARTKAQADADWAKACADATTAKKADDDAGTAQKAAAAALTKACDDVAAAKKADDDATAARTKAHDALTKANDATAAAKKADDDAAKAQKDAADALARDTMNAALKTAKVAADKKKSETADALAKANDAATLAKTAADAADKDKADKAAALAKADAAANDARAKANAADAAKTATAATLATANGAATTAKTAADAADKDKSAKDAAFVQANDLIAALTKSDTDAATAKSVADALKAQADKALTKANTDSTTAATTAANQAPFDKKIAARVGIAFATNSTDGKGFAWLLQADQGQASVRFVQDGVKLGKTLLFDGGWQPATKYWLKLRLDTGGGKTVLSGKAWLDSATEPGDWQLIQDDWTWPAASSPLLPSLCGGIYANGKSEISVSFDNICIEALNPTSATAYLGPAPMPPVASRPPLHLQPLEEPEPDATFSFPSVAIKSLMIGKWGTLVGYAPSDEPVYLKCLPPLCPWPIPSVKGECCGGGVLPFAAVALPEATVLAPGAAEECPIPGGAPALVPPLIVPSAESDLQPHGHEARDSRRPAPVLLAGYRAQEDDTPDPTALETPRIVRELKTREATQRVLRNFGGVATTPWPQPEDALMSGARPLGPSSSRTDQVPHDPFFFQPRVDVIPLPPSRYAELAGASGPGPADPASPYTASPNNLPPDVDEIVDDHSGRVWTYHFDMPARFAKPMFGPACCAYEGELAIIHEGMRVLARTDGQYEVRFNVTAPAMPVMVRLQLVLYEEGGMPPRTLTLPPIALKPWGESPYPDRKVQPSIDPVSYLVRVRGYSQFIMEIQTGYRGRDPSRTKHFVLIKRIGSARFGSGFQSQPTP